MRWRLMMLLWGAAACTRAPGTAEVDFRHNPTGQGTKVARFGQDSVTAEELKDYWGSLSPYARARFATADQRRDYVEGMVRFELLVAEAVRRGLANDPEVVHRTKTALVERVLRYELDEKPMSVTDAEVKAYYDQHRDDYQKPEMLRLFHVFLAAPADDAKARATKKKLAGELLVQARALAPMDYPGFGELAKKHSEDPRSKDAGGDLRFLPPDELAKAFGQPLVDAARELREVGEVLARVVETDQGFHVIKLQGQQAALHQGVKEVEASIQAIVLHEKKMASLTALLDGLNKAAGTQVDAQALEKLTLDPKAQAAPRKVPEPGFLPAPSPPSLPTR